MTDSPAAGRLRRSAILRSAEYDLAVDLTGSSDTFLSRTEMRFGCTSPGAATFADLHAVSVYQAALNGTALDTGAYHDGRLELSGLARENRLIVLAEFRYSSAGAGLYRTVDPLNGSTCVYSKAYRGGAPRIFCCFDQPDLRACFTVTAQAPAGWSCLGNTPAVSRPLGGAGGAWRFAPTALIPPGVSSLCAGPFSTWARMCEREPGQALPVAVHALPSAGALVRPDEVLASLGQALRYYERVLDMPYPYPKCDVLFVPGFPGLAFSAPGLIAVRDEALRPGPPGAGDLYLPMVIAHELAHAWIGNLANICTGPDIEMWLIEALATYLSRVAVADIYPGSTPWAASTASSFPDHGYAANAAVIRQLETLIGRQAVIAGLGQLLRAHSHGSATTGDLVRCWSLAGKRDLGAWAASALAQG